MSILKVDSSFFTGDEMNIPNLSTSSVGVAGAISQGNSAKLIRLIEKKEPEFLKKVLGKDLYTQFKTGMTVESPAEPDECWKKIASLLVDSTLKVSPFANYVWWWWARYNTTNTTSLGEASPKQENADAVTSVYRQVSTWNEMVEMLNEFRDYMNSNSATYNDAYLPDDEVYSTQNTFNF